MRDLSRRLSRRFLIALSFLVCSATFAQDSPSGSEAASDGASAAQSVPAPAMVERGKSLYAHDCSHCHGFNMVNPGTISYDLRQFPHNDKARFTNSVTNGKNGRMPPWAGALTSDEIDAIWAYVLTGGKT